MRTRAASKGRGRHPARRQTEPGNAQSPDRPEPYRVLICAHRPAYRARAERAVAEEGWEVRSLLNREDPIGLINRKPPALFIITVDADKNANVGYLRAAQRYRGEGMRVIGLFENAEQATAAKGQCDLALVWPWRTAELRGAALRLHRQARVDGAASGAEQGMWNLKMVREQIERRKETEREGAD